MTDWYGIVAVILSGVGVGLASVFLIVRLSPTTERATDEDAGRFRMILTAGIIWIWCLATLISGASAIFPDDFLDVGVARAATTIARAFTIVALLALVPFEMELRKRK